MMNLGVFYSSLVTIIAIIALGFFLGRKKLISSKTNADLVNLLLTIFMPAALLSAFPTEFSQDSAELFAQGFLAGLAVMFAMTLAAGLFFSKTFFKGELRYEAKFAFIFNNATFLGYPLISTAFGQEVVIAYCGFIVAFNFALFSYGVYLFERKLSPKFFKELFLNPNIIAVLLGMVMFLSGFHLWSPLQNAVSYVAAATTPLSLVCIGYMLSRAEFKALWKRWRLAVIAGMQLVFAPFLTWLVTIVLRFPSEVVTVCTLIQALPTATSLGLFAEKYGGHQVEASELVVISTALSMVTLPLVVLLLA